MGSSAVKAQRLANEANVQMTRETNEQNYKMFQEQNQWNLDQWNRENEYNSPSAQMQRYMEAGINPIWAMSGGDAGSAAHLESANAPSFQSPHVNPEFNGDAVATFGQILAAAKNVTNDAMGFYKLALETEDVDTRRRAQASQAALNVAESFYKRSQTEGQNIFNNLSMDTYATNVLTKVSELREINSRIDKTKSDTSLNSALEDNARATKSQIEAMTNYVGVQAYQALESIKQKWRELQISQQNADIARQNADTAEFSARSQSYYQGENLKLSAKQYSLDVERMTREFNQVNNSQLLKYVIDSRSAIEKIVGHLPYTFELWSDPSGEKSSLQIANYTKQLEAIGVVLSKRVEGDPSAENVKSYQEYLNTLNEINKITPDPQSVPQMSYPSAPSVLNPSPSWQQ